MAKRETRNEGGGCAHVATTLQKEREREGDFSPVRARWGEEVGRLKPASAERAWADAPSSAKYRAAVATAMAASTCARFVKFRERERESIRTKAPGTGSREDFIKIETRHLCWKLPIRRKPTANTRSDTLEFLFRRRRRRSTPPRRSFFSA